MILEVVALLVTKKRLIIAGVLVLIILFALLALAAYTFLSGRTVYAELVGDRVRDAFANLSYDLHVGSLSGNPITGVNGRSVFISHEGVVIASADAVDYRLNLSSVLSSPKLSSMTFKNLHMDWDTLLANLPTSLDGGGAPALENLFINGATLTTPWGTAEISNAAISLGRGEYRGKVEGSFRERPLTLAAALKNQDGKMLLRSAGVKWNASSLNVSGQITPDLQLSGDAGNIDMDEIAELFPAIARTTLSGVYSASFDVRSGDGLQVAADVQTNGGRLWRFPFSEAHAHVKFENNQIAVRGLDATMMGGVLSGDADIRLLGGEGPQIAAKMQGAPLHVDQMAEALPWLGRFSGVLDAASFDVTGTLASLSGRAFLFGKDVGLAGFPGKNFHADLRIKNSATLNLVFNGNALGADVIGSGDIALKPSVRLNLNVDIPIVPLAALGTQVPQIREAGVQGTGRAYAKITGTPADIQVDGNVAFPSLSLPQSQQLTDVSARFAYSQEGLSLQDVNASWNGITIAGGGNHKPDAAADKKLSFSGNVSNINLAQLESQFPATKSYGMSGNISGNWRLQGDFSNPNVEFQLQAPRVVLFKKFPLDGVRLNGTYQSRNIEIKRASANLGKARLLLSGDIDMPRDDSSVTYNIKGSFDRLDPALLVEMGVVSADLSGDLAGDIRVWSEAGTPPSLRIFFRNSHIIYKNLADISHLNGLVTLQNGNLLFNKLRTQINMGYIAVDGSVGNIGAARSSDMPLDLTATIASADIGRIARIFNPLSKGFQGIVEGTANIRGNVANPEFRAEASLHGGQAYGLFLPVVRFHNVSGNLNGVEFPSIRAVVGRGRIEANGRLVRTQGGSWGASVKASGKDVNIRSLTFSLDEDTRSAITGTLNFEFEGNGWTDAFDGHGTAFIPRLSAMGLVLTDVKAPFWVSDGFVLVEESSAQAYGGLVSAQVAKDIKQSDWGGRLQVTSADMASALADLMPNSPGTVSGSADLTVRFGGDTRRTSMQDASGSLEVRNGEVRGYPGTTAVSRLIGGRPLRFSDALLSFSVDSKMIYLLPGSRVSAPKGDPVFKYIMVDGSISMEREINLACVGNVNIRALNAFAGGIQGLLSAAMEGGDTDMLLQNFLGSAIAGFSRNEFRDVSLRVVGTPDHMDFRNVTVASPTKYDMLPPGLRDAEDEKERELGEKIEIKLEFPVGPGGDNSGANLGGQVGGQVIEQALKGILTF